MWWDLCDEAGVKFWYWGVPALASGAVPVVARREWGVHAVCVRSSAAVAPPALGTSSRVLRVIHALGPCSSPTQLHAFSSTPSVTPTGPTRGLPYVLERCVSSLCEL